MSTTFFSVRSSLTRSAAGGKQSLMNIITGHKWISHLYMPNTKKKRKQIIQRNTIIQTQLLQNRQLNLDRSTWLSSLLKLSVYPLFMCRQQKHESGWNICAQLPERSGPHFGLWLCSDRAGRFEVSSQDYRHCRNAFFVQGSTLQVSQVNLLANCAK